MKTRLAKEAPPLDTIEWLVKEAVECSKPLGKLRQKLLSLERGCETYLEALAEIAVASEVLKAKLNSLISAIDAAEDDLPNED